MKRVFGVVMALMATVNGCDSQPSERIDSSVQFELWVETRSENTDSVNKLSFQVRVADTDELRQRGLSGVRQLSSGTGMLFVVPKPAQMQMWMKGCHIPLDVLYFDSDKKLINFHIMTVPVVGTADYYLPRYPSDKRARYALEVAGGTAGRLGIKPGLTRISFSRALLKRLGEGTE